MRASISMQWTILREINPLENDVPFLKIFQLVKTEESSSKVFQIKWQNDFYLKASFEKVLLTHSNLKWLEINPFLSKLIYLCPRHLKKKSDICWKQNYISIFHLPILTSRYFESFDTILNSFCKQTAENKTKTSNRTGHRDIPLG